MYLRKLKISSYKNWSEAELDFCPKVNCFVGDNGAGKTNVLDAVYYLSFCRSYFSVADSNNIRHDEGFFALHGNYDRGKSLPDEVSCLVRRGQRKQFRLNQKDYERLADHIGLVPLVIITPADSVLVTGGSEERRKYIDSVISQFDRTYLDDLISYNKALSQRNALLKQFAEQHYFEQSLLHPWDRQLIDLGNRIYAQRKVFIEAFQPVFSMHYDDISGSKEKAGLVYASQLNESGMDTLLDTTLQKDRILKYTSAGVHKDDLGFNIDGYSLKRFGSQGQQKTFLVSVKLAQFQYMKEKKGYKPILLLDDIFDKLDHHRVSHMMRLVSENTFGQIFISDTSRDRIERVFDGIDTELKIFNVEQGQIA